MQEGLFKMMLFLYVAGREQLSLFTPAYHLFHEQFAMKIIIVIAIAITI